MRKVYLLFFMCLLIQTASFGQQRIITGRIIDASDKSALAGATVMVKGTAVGAITDAKGNYSIRVDEKNILVFSFVGMKTVEIPIGSRTVINVSMQPSQDMDEVVVIGYGAVRKSDMTGSVGSLNTEKVLKTQPLSINQAMLGRLAGVQVNQNDGAPGGGISIIIRGANSFSTSAEPLYVVDGVPFDTGGAPSGGTGRAVNALSFINPQDIQSLEVLKDASATAIYGSRGSNGVVLITTKKGRKGEDKIEISANFSTSKLANNVDFLDGHDYAQYRNEMQRNNETYNGITFGEPTFPGIWKRDEAAKWDYYYPAPIDFKRGYMNGGMKWIDEVLQSAVTQDYNLSYSGGDDKGSYYISGNFLDQTGVIYGSGYTRGNIRMNIERNLKKWITVGTNVTATRAETQFANTNWQSANIFGTALYYPPTEPIMDPATEDFNSQLSFFSDNPYNFVRGNFEMVYTNQVAANAFINIKFFDGLSFRQTVGYGHTYNQREAYTGRDAGGAGNKDNGYATQGDNWYQNMTSESMLTYDKRFEKHWVSAVAGWTLEQADYGSKWMSNYKFPNDNTLMYNMGAGLGTKNIGSGRGRTSLMSFLARVNYSYKDRYLATASVRRDGSSKFSAANKWGNFFAFALSWRMEQEEFMKSLEFVNNFKWRVSYGQTGNQAISPYQTKEIFNNSVIVTGDGSTQPGYAEAVWKGPLNPNLFWETTEQYNAGVDIGLFDSRLNVTLDVYYKKTHDLLQNLTIPPSSGFNSITTNYGTVNNKGIELTVNTAIFRNQDFKWDLTANIYWNRNKIQGLKSDQFPAGVGFDMDGMYILRNGRPIGTLYGYVEDGFFDSEAEIRANPEYAYKPDNFIKTKIGEIKYRNMDNEPSSISSTDQVVIGNVNPDYEFGFTNDFQWKNWTCSFFFQGVMGNDILNLNLRQHVNMTNIGNIPQFAYDERWTPENAENAKFPKPYAGLDRKVLFSRRYVEDGSYLRLKNINIGYTFYNPVKFISSINIFANATNLFTITKYRWFDPDVNANGGDPARRGMDASSYPSARTYSFGVRMGF